MLLLEASAALLLAFVIYAVYAFLMRGTPAGRVRTFDSRTPDVAGREPAADAAEDGALCAPFDVSDPAFCEFVPMLSGTSLGQGNALELHTEGDAFFERLLAALAEARTLITWQVFWYKPGRLADRVAAVLCERAAAGVRVLMLLDAVGSQGLPPGYRERLRRAGIEVRVARPLRWHTLYKAQQRIHVRAVVIDGRVGFTGGFGIDDRWMGDGRHRGQWRDTSVKVEGPAVGQLQGAFVSVWAEATGEIILGDRVFDSAASRRAASSARGATAGLLYSAPSLGSTAAERFLVVTVAAARRRLWITSAYFVPDRDLRRLLAAAARRGVDVRVLTPGGNTDRPATWYAARAHYAELLDAGVTVYEYRPTMVHAKTLVVDGTWAMVGTLNVDNRSMVLNDEAALLVWDRELGNELEAAFEADLRHSEEITHAMVRRRSRGVARVKELAAARVSRLL